MIEKSTNASVIFHAIKLAETWRKNGDEICKQFGITTQQWLILLLLANDPNIIYLQEHPQYKPLLASELADAMNVSRANITNLLNVLLEKELIVQIEDDLDKRRKRLKLSKKGEDVIRTLEPIRVAKNNNFFAETSENEKQAFIKFVKKCLHKMPH